MFTKKRTPVLTPGVQVCEFLQSLFFFLLFLFKPLGALVEFFPNLIDFTFCTLLYAWRNLDNFTRFNVLTHVYTHFLFISCMNSSTLNLECQHVTPTACRIRNLQIQTPCRYFVQLCLQTVWQAFRALTQQSPKLLLRQTIKNAKRTKGAILFL